MTAAMPRAVVYLPRYAKRRLCRPFVSSIKRAIGRLPSPHSPAQPLSSVRRARARFWASPVQCHLTPVPLLRRGVHPPPRRRRQSDEAVRLSPCAGNVSILHNAPLLFPPAGMRNYPPPTPTVVVVVEPMGWKKSVASLPQARLCGSPAGYHDSWSVRAAAGVPPRPPPLVNLAARS